MEVWSAIRKTEKFGRPCKCAIRERSAGRTSVVGVRQFLPSDLVVESTDPTFNSLTGSIGLLRADLENLVPSSGLSMGTSTDIPISVLMSQQPLGDKYDKYRHWFLRLCHAAHSDVKYAAEE